MSEVVAAEVVESRLTSWHISESLVIIRKHIAELKHCLTSIHTTFMYTEQYGYMYINCVLAHQHANSSYKRLGNKQVVLRRLVNHCVYCGRIPPYPFH